MSDASDRPPRVLLAIGNPERERQLLTALRDGGWTIAGRCLDGPSLVQQAIAGNVDVVLASAGLHRLTGESFIAVREADVPMVLLAGPAEAEAYDGLSYVLPAASDGPVIIAALHEAIRRGAVVSRVAADGLSTPERPNHGDLGDGEVIALASGKGAPGTTTVAIGLAAALSGRKKSVALVDADLRGGAVGPYLDLDPRRGLSGLSVEPSNRPERVLDELQDGPGFAILTGIERPEAQERLAPERIAGAVSALQERFDTVLIDNGETLSGGHVGDGRRIAQVGGAGPAGDDGRPHRALECPRLIAVRDRVTGRPSGGRLGDHQPSPRKREVRLARGGAGPRDPRGCRDPGGPAGSASRAGGPGADHRRRREGCPRHR